MTKERIKFITGQTITGEVVSDTADIISVKLSNGNTALYSKETVESRSEVKPKSKAKAKPKPKADAGETKETEDKQENKESTESEG